MKPLLTFAVLIFAAAAYAAPPSKEVEVINTPNVVVTNDSTMPVPTINVGAKDYIHIYDVTLIGTGDNGFGVFGFGKTIYTVPLGKRLVIETVSPSVSDIEGVNYDVTVRPNDSAGGLNFALVTKGVYAAGTIPEKGRDALTSSAILVVGPQVDLVYQMIRDVSSSTESAGTSVTVIGYLENSP